MAYIGQTLPVSKSGVQKTITRTTSNNITFPPGAYYVHIRPLEYNKPIKINGQNFVMTEEYHRQAQLNSVTKTQDFVGEVAIVSNTNRYIVTISYPSHHNVNFSELGF